MELALQILLGLVALICLLGGLNLLLKGAGPFLPGATPPPRLDNLFRFLSGIYFGLGFLMSWVVFHFHKVNDLIYFIGLVVIFSSLGRLYSKTKVGSAEKYFEYIMVVEIILGSSIVLLQWLRDSAISHANNAEFLSKLLSPTISTFIS
jgi:hypothetical protein